MTMLDHISLGCSDLEASGAFYDAALAPLGYCRVFERNIGVAYGPGPDREGLLFWIVQPRDVAAGPRHSRGTHVAFRASRRDDVDAFFDAALTAGGEANGAPGLRPEYSETYYAAFVRDLDGHKIEAVCRRLNHNHEINR
jgi:catechol 2,3-dioxygenase-like lactoylglutathione lyase family enzyme